MPSVFLSSALQYGNTPQGSELLFHPFPLFRVSRAAQIFTLDFSNDGSADIEDKFTDGGLANQILILQGIVYPSCYQVSQRYC